MLYKLINNRPTPFDGRNIRHDGNIYANPTQEQLKAVGYKPLESAERPEDEDGYYWAEGYTETDTAIVQTWEKHEIIEETEVWENGENL